MISAGLGTGKLSFVRRVACAMTVLVAASTAVSISFAKGAEGPEAHGKRAETNQPGLLRPLGPISTEEAQAALKRIKTPEAGQGTWRKIDVMDDTSSTQTNIVYH